MSDGSEGRGAPTPAAALERRKRAAQRSRDRRPSSATRPSASYSSSSTGGADVRVTLRRGTFTGWRGSTPNPDSPEDDPAA